MSDISAADPHPRKRVEVLDSEMSYVDVGEGPVVILQHGNPTSSYLWRNVIPHLAGQFRCIAPDLIGMGQSGKNPAGSYTFQDHAKYLDAFLDAVVPEGRVAWVLHDWGGALGFHWSNRNRDRVAALAYMETIIMPVSWDDWPEGARGIFQGFRSDKGEGLILERNMFIEGVLPNAIMRDLTKEEHDVYRAPFTEGGEVRRPMLTWPRQIPIEGEPADVVQVVSDYGAWLKADDKLPKLFVNAEPGSITIGKAREFCRSWPNQEEISVRGLHFIQEDSPHEIGEASAAFFAKHHTE